MARRKDTAVIETTIENLDVDVETVDDETEDVAAPAAKEPKAKKEPARGDLPEGHVTPVGLAKLITERGEHTNRDGEVVELKPQMVYSYIKNAPKDDPFPFVEGLTDSLGKPRQAATVADALAWWDRKKTRAGERKANAAAKAEKKATAKTDEPVAEDEGAVAEEAE